MLFVVTMVIAREAPTGIIVGLFFAIGAILMAHQTINNYREGFMYCGGSARVYRKQNPVKFKIWLVIQTFFVLFLSGYSIYAFLA